MSFTIAPIVEGHGDVPAIRVLITRLVPELIVATAVRQPRGKLIQRQGLNHAVAIASANIVDQGAILIVFDADEDCAAELSQKIDAWLREDFGHLTSRVVLPVREFESWIVGGDPQYGVELA